MQLYDQFGPINYHSPNVSVYFTKEKIKANKSVIDFNLNIKETEGLVLEITPKTFGKYFLHVLVNDCEIPDMRMIEISPCEDDILNAQAEEEKKSKETAAEKEKREKIERIEQEKKKALELQEENLKKKKDETEKRAQDALKSHREKQEKEKEKEEKERKQRLEMKTGGGFDLRKKKGK